MNLYIDRFLESLNAGKVSECVRLSTFESIPQSEIIISSATFNIKLLSLLKENLHNLKGKYLYDFVIGAYLKASHHSISFSATEMILKDGEPSVDLVHDDTEKQALPAALNVDMFYLAMSHLIQLVQQKLIHSSEQIALIGSILKLIALFAENKEIQSICRRQKFISNFLKLFSDVVLTAQSNELIAADESHLAVLVSHVIAKLALRNKKNQEYLIRKKAHELFQPVLLVAERNSIIFVACAGIIANLASSVDARLMLWSTGIVGVCKKLLACSGQNRAVMELNLILLARLTHECSEVIDDLVLDIKGFQLPFQKIFECGGSGIDSSIYKHEETLVFALGISIVRKIASIPKYRLAFLKQYYKYPFEFLSQFERLREKKSAAVFPFAIRECLALIGVMSIEEEGRQFALVSYPKISKTMLTLSLMYFEDVKLVKFALGGLTNLCVIEKNREELSKDNDFYALICQTMDRYDFNDQLIMNCLKLMLNNTSNVLCSKNFCSPVIMLKLLFLGFAYVQHAQIADLLCKILKVLCAPSSVLLQSLIKCYREYEISNSKYKFVRVFLAQIRVLHGNSQAQTVIDSIQLLASLCSVDKQLVKELQENQEFVALIKDILNSKRSNQKELQKFSSALAYFPLEEFKGLLTL